MRILYLGPMTPLVRFLEEEGGNAVHRTEDKLSDFGDAEFVVSYGYRHIIKNVGELRRMDGRAINLHISYLPWNRGADPNLWSFIEDTPKGVTIHYLDAGIDTGDIIVQRKVFFDVDDTLATSYERLHEAMRELFCEHWHSIKRGECQRLQQHGVGSFHRSRDKERISLPLGWDTNVCGLTTS